MSNNTQVKIKMHPRYTIPQRRNNQALNTPIHSASWAVVAGRTRSTNPLPPAKRQGPIPPTQIAPATIASTSICLCLSQVETKYSKTFVCNVFRHLRAGKIDQVQESCTRFNQYRKIMLWISPHNTEDLLWKRLLQNKTAHIVYDDPHFWTVIREPAVPL